MFWVMGPAELHSRLVCHDQKMRQLMPFCVIAAKASSSPAIDYRDELRFPQFGVPQPKRNSLCVSLKLLRECSEDMLFLAAILGNNPRKIFIAMNLSEPGGELSL